MENTEESQLIAAYGTGSANIGQLRTYVAEAWQEIINEPTKRSAAAQALEIASDDILAMPHAPVQFQTGRSGLGAVDFAVLVVLWIGQDILLASLKEIAKDELKKRVRRLWVEVLEPAVRRRLPDRHGLGPASNTR